ncbi:dehydrogenase [Angomonas deanei]|uniref:NAD binding domain of 6-phosphogluconate dehydrogenase/NAD-binding of NADP-dependent 3-hydroxyisobutyrate dehydrogenase, putative n=1 Tax=Angomonas deanei TaxID=59799 RepID=A0A7G2CLF0_9TRYP|nr:dehydrogenase [Angomonas deanei]CAD2220245.1 NAD binding domain of 6-phosphogluconate dehydrogenase/NAD-binding of NADP-dependent 3-hydroxyisobutyrate dehydrogenase, putative [Angomonas deanei]|eukprot:EPY15507.1 dehydrogenase [Angomonas deanei]
MGFEMAKNLVESEHKFHVKVYNRTISKAEPLTKLGAVAVTDPKELADVDILFSMVANDAAFQQSVVESGLLEGMRIHHDTHRGGHPSAIHVSCATLPVAFVDSQTKLHEEHHVRYMAMPVLGRPDAAAARKLHLMMAGDEETMHFLQPLVVPTLGQSLRYYGAAPLKANVMKIAFNFTLASAIETISEGSALVQKYDMESSDFTSLLSGTLFDCIAYNGYGNIISSRQFQPAGATLSGVGVKDVNLALQAGERVHCPLPFGSVMRDNMMEGVAVGMGEWDWSSVAVVAERHAGIEH